MGLFEKKYCDFCGNKIGMLGNKKFEDGNMCKECASKLSPWFNERRRSTRADLEAQLAYREENKSAVAAFQTTRSIGRHTKLLIDDNARKFMVTSASNLATANPDVMDFSQATGCSLDIQESRNEIKDKDKDGKPVSYQPPRYEYSYNFYVTLHVNTPFFDEIKYSLSNGYIKTGEQPMNTMSGSWNMHSASMGMRTGVTKYNEMIALGNEIKDAVDGMRMGGMAQAPGMQQGFHPQPQQQMAPQGPTVCPFCNAQLQPGAKFCEYCGGQLM